MRTIAITALVAFVFSAGAAIADQPAKSPDDLMREGWRLLDRGNAAGALKIFEEVIKAAPDVINVDAHRGYQDAMRDLGKKAELTAEYKKMAESKPDSAAACYLYSRLLEDPKAQREWLEKARNIDDKFPYIYLSLGALDNAARDYDNAIKNLKRAIELKPDLKDAYVALGMIYMGEAKPDDAVEIYNQAAKNLPKESFPHSLLCDIYFAIDKNDKALEEINAAIAIRPDRPDYIIRKAEILVKKGDKAGVMEQVRRICDLDPTLFEARNAYAIAAAMTTPELGFKDERYDSALQEMSKGNMEGALTLLTKIGADKGDVALVDYQIGKVYEIQGSKEDEGAGSIEKAIEYYDKAAKAFPNFADAFCGLAVAQYKLSSLLAGEKDKSGKLIALSEKTALHVVLLNPLHPEANLLLARICHARGEYEKAVKYAALSYKVSHDYDEARPFLMDEIYLLPADAKPATEFKIDSYIVKVFPVSDTLRLDATITRRFDVYDGDKIYRRFFEEVLTERNNATGVQETSYRLYVILDKDNNASEVFSAGDEEPKMEAFRDAIKEALQKKPSEK
jgi:tetratricopeptide (TPR) repeat protein